MPTVLRHQETELDASFLRMLRGGDPEAFAVLVRVFLPQIRRMAMHYFRSPHDQEEAIQEAFLLLHRHRESIDPLRAQELPGFVLTLARRRMLDLLRARGKELPAEEVREEHWVDESQAPFERAAASELVALLERFEQRLKPAYQPFFRAVFVEGRDVDEAREALGLRKLRARYLKLVLLRALRRHQPLQDYLGKRGRS